MIKEYKRVDLYLDVMMIRKRNYLVCKGGRVNYTTSYPLENKTGDEVLKKVQAEMTKYKERGLEVTSVHVDNAFNTEKFQSGIEVAILVPYAANEHVGIVEREIRTLKERAQQALTSKTASPNVPSVLYPNGHEQPDFMPVYNGRKSLPTSGLSQSSTLSMFGIIHQRKRMYVHYPVSPNTQYHP